MQEEEDLVGGDMQVFYEEEDLEEFEPPASWVQALLDTEDLGQCQIAAVLLLLFFLPFFTFLMCVSSYMHACMQFYSIYFWFRAMCHLVHAARVIILYKLYSCSLFCPAAICIFANNEF